LVELVLEAT